MGPLPLKPILGKLSFGIILLCTVMGDSITKVTIDGHYTVMDRGGLSTRERLFQWSKDRLQMGEVASTIPTIGFNVETVQYNNIKFQVWDLGGQTSIRYLFLSYVFSRKHPNTFETEQRVTQVIIRSAIDFERDPWPKVSDNAKDLVKKMLNPDPKQHLTVQEVLEHPWLQNAKKAPNILLGKTVKARLKQFSIMNKLKKRDLNVKRPDLLVGLQQILHTGGILG
ncbi:hypothetical protein PVK06_005188 [Gossypium arboreum]|uniref:Protein kinase domain-containing protein n=1 Tax=Gossypium arboreum TaxID=29729 RepID=A0ABR0QUX8_GOSAR|nr:hypothetical protein PVK06_005188 [Gossypium arboreum]